MVTRDYSCGMKEYLLASRAVTLWLTLMSRYSWCAKHLGCCHFPVGEVLLRYRDTRSQCPSYHQPGI